jgi:hypothetical protein
MHTSTRRRFTATLSVLALGTLALAAVAAVNLKGKANFSDQGTTLNTQLCLSGLGNQDVTLSVRAVGNATTLCTNRGGNEAPGQNKTPVSVLGTQTIPAKEIKNGNVCFNVSTTPPSTPTNAEAGCPTGQSVSITDVAFSGVEVTATQGGQTVFNGTFTP